MLVGDKTIKSSRLPTVEHKLARQHPVQHAEHTRRAGLPSVQVVEKEAQADGQRNGEDEAGQAPEIIPHLHVHDIDIGIMCFSGQLIVLSEECPSRLIVLSKECYVPS